MTRANPDTPVPPAGGYLLVDASSHFFRAWFGVPDRFFDRRGRPLNGVVGFAGALLSLVSTARPAGVAVAFDEALFSGFRHRLDPGYKASRVLPDPALAFQLSAARRLVEGLGLAALASGEFEADDLLATLARRVRGTGTFSVVASEDKDLAQAIGDHDILWQAARARVLDRPALTGWLGLDPSRLAERQALTGDPVDDIPGVPGIGEKTANALLTHCGHLEELLAAPARVAGLPLRGAAGLAERLEAHADRVRLNLRLARLEAQVPGLPRVAALRYRAPRADDVMALGRDLDLPAATTRRLAGLAGEGR